MSTSSSRLQLVFLGRLIEGDGANDHANDPQGVLWHDLDRTELRRLQSALRSDSMRSAEIPSLPDDEIWHDTVTMPDEQTAALFETTPEAAAETPPFPVLMDCEDEPAPETHKPWSYQSLHKPATPSAMRTARPLPAMHAPSRLVVCCPNCGERQTMRVLCHGCASFLEVAMKAKAERHDQARSKARANSLFALLGV